MLCSFGMTNAQNAQKIYTYVRQDNVKLSNLGTAAFDIAGTPRVAFDDEGNAVMKIGDNTVAKLPMKHNGELIVEFETSLEESQLNTVKKTVSQTGYATIYSPFQLTLPSESKVNVYAPTYDADNYVLKCNPNTLIAANATLPVETGLLLKNKGDIQFTISPDDATVENKGALSGSSLKIDKSYINIPSGSTLYTLGHNIYDSSEFWFLPYIGTTINSGLAYLLTNTVSEAAGAKVYLSFDDDSTTGISQMQNQQLHPNKYIDNNRVIIQRGNKYYNLNGQEVTK